MIRRRKGRIDGGSRAARAAGALFAVLSLCFPALGVDLSLSPSSAPLDDPGVPGLHIEVHEAVGTGSGLSLSPESPCHWHRDADEQRPFRLEAWNSGRIYDHAILTAWNWDNEAVASLRIEPGDSREIEISVEGLGSWLLTLDGFSGGECRRRLVRNIAVTEDLDSARVAFREGEFFLGVCAFPGRYHWDVGGEPARPAALTEAEARELEASLLARLGFSVVRVDECMEMGTPLAEGGDYRFDFARMDASVKAYTSRGFELALQLMSAPEWAVAPGYAGVAPELRWRYPHRERAQRAYVAALLERYGEQARFVQVFNEPDQVEFWAGTPEEFVEQFRYTHEEIRRLLPDVPVANGGYAFADRDRVRLFAKRLRPFLDRPAYHSHGPLGSLRETFAEMREIHSAAGYGAPRYLNTETGFDSWRLDQDRRQAQAVTQKALFCWAHGHEGALLFCGRMVKGPGREDRDLGLLDYEFGPRFSYAAVAGLVSVLAGAEFDGVIEETEETFVYRFRRGEDRIVAAFCLGEERTIPLESDAKRTVLVDPMGNREEAGTTGNVTLPLDAYPRYVVFEGAGKVVLR